MSSTGHQGTTSDSNRKQEAGNANTEPSHTNGFVVTADEGQPFWFLNTLTINKIGSQHGEGQLSIIDHRAPPSFAPPPHIHEASDEALLVLDGQLDGFCGNQARHAGPGCLVFIPRAIPTASPSPMPGRAGSLSSPPPADSTNSSRPPTSQPRTCACPNPSRPIPPASPS